MKIQLEAELEYDADLMHGDDADSIRWFYRKVMLVPPGPDGLSLQSDMIGDEVGTIKVTKIIIGGETIT